MSFAAILSRIANGVDVPAEELLPYLCLEREEYRANVNRLLAEAYWSSGREEFRGPARVSIQRAWLLSRFSPELLPLYTEIHAGFNDIRRIREAYKRVGMMMAARGDVGRAIKYFNQWQYADVVFARVDRYEYDFDILDCIDKLAQPYRLAPTPGPKLNADGKLRIAYLLKGVRELGSVLIKLHLLYAKFHDRSKFEPMFFVPECEQEVLSSPWAVEHVRQFENLGYPVHMAAAGKTKLETLLAVRDMIHSQRPDLLVTGAALADFAHCFIASLRPAAYTVGFVLGPPEQFAPLTLDWGIAWSKHPLIDCPVSCTLMDMELEMVDRANVIPLARSEIGIPDDAVILGTAGRYVKFQDSRFWEAILQLLAEHPNLYYLPMGVHEKEIPFLSSLLTPETRTRIRFRPWRGDDYLSALALVQIYLDTFPSGGGTVLHDALCLGIPVVSFENNYMRIFDQVDWSPADGFNMPEILVARGDFTQMKRVISELIKDPERRREAGDKCRKRLEETRGNPERAVRRCEEIFSRLVHEDLGGEKKPSVPEHEVATLAHMNISKFAVLSHILPPSPSGQATMLSRLLGTVPPDKYCLISNENAEARRQDDYEGLPTAYFLLPPERELKRPNRFGLSHWRQSANLWWRARQRARAIARILRAEGCNALIACSGDVLNIAAGYLASRWAGTQFFVYLFDDYVYQWTDPLYRSFARRAEAVAVRRAAAVITPNEFARDEYRRRYGIEPVIIRNPIVGQSQSKVVKRHHMGSDSVRIVYTGAVYHATADALRNLVQAIDRLNRPAVQLHIYSSQAATILDDFDLRGPLAYHNHVTPAEAENIQRDADILFLPLSFNSGIPEVIRTSAPGKMGEYLASGRPIIAHSPPDSFVSWYFRKHDCGIVVDQNKPDALAEAIDRLLADDQLRKTISENAQTRAQLDFSLVAAQSRFLKLLSGERHGV